MSSAVQTAEVLTNYLQALGTIGVAPPTGYSPVLAAGLLAWARLPNYSHLVVIFDHDDVYEPTPFGRRHHPQNPVINIGEKYYFRLPDRPLTETNSPTTPPSPPPPSPPQDDKRPPINIKGKTDGPPAHSNPSVSTPPVLSVSIPPTPPWMCWLPNEDDIINLLPANGNAPGFDPSPEASAILGLKVSGLLRQPVAKQRDWWSITEIIEQTTKSYCLDMDSIQLAECTYLTNYLHACARAEFVHEDDDDYIAALGLIAWADFPNNQSIYQSFCFHSSQTPASLQEDNYVMDNNLVRLRTYVAPTSSAPLPLQPTPSAPQLGGRTLDQEGISSLYSNISSSLNPAFAAASSSNSGLTPRYDPSPEADAILSKIINDLLKRPSAAVGTLVVY